jgi:hypothetical protein
MTVYPPKFVNGQICSGDLYDASHLEAPDAPVVIDINGTRVNARLIVVTHLDGAAREIRIIVDRKRLPHVPCP